MTNVLSATRRHPDYVTIAHLSDLHLVPEGAMPRFHANPDRLRGWKPLISDVASQKPDLICVTGDIVDNPQSDLIKKTLDIKSLYGILTGDSAHKAWVESLEGTYRDGLSLLSAICAECGIDPDVGLYVVPGNHDYRIQGYIGKSGQASGGGTTSTFGQAPSNRFESVLGSYFRSGRVRFDAARDSGGEAIHVDIVGFDSLAVDVLANFATGAISEDEYEKFRFFDEAPHRDALLCSEFRVALVHHHPLPVVPSEFLRLGPPATTKQKIEDVFQVAQGEQTMLFKNGGTFLCGALRTRVNLILHGHQHRSWFTSVRYPTVAGDHRMLVAAAGSIGEMTDGYCRYNIVRLYRNGNIRVLERSRANNPPEYEGAERLRLFGDGELRLARHDLARRQIVAQDSRNAPTVGLAEADQILRHIEIREDGSADFTTTLTNLRAAGEDVQWLQMINQFSAGASLETPLCTVQANPNNHYSVSVGAKPAGEPNTTVWGLIFNPRLTGDCPLSIELKYRVYNCFDFVEEYFRGRQGNEGTIHVAESITYSPQRIFPRRLVQSVAFPDGWKPQQPPKLEVLLASGAPDIDEQTFHEKSLDYVATKGVASLAVDLPLPGNLYRITWPLDTLDQYESPRYTRTARNFARKLRLLSISDALRKGIDELVEGIHAKFSQPSDDSEVALFGERTELTLYLVRQRDVGTESIPASKAFLELAGSAGSFDRKLDRTQEFEGGAGLIGLAQRSGRTQVVRKGRDMAGYLVREGDRRHVALWCVPLAIPGKARSAPVTDTTSPTRTPIYAIFCAGTHEDDGSLDDTGDPFKIFEAYMTGDFNRELFARLTAP
jgi:3',5'-cyclic AMP phosphodiesterase CpdA